MVPKRDDVAATPDVRELPAERVGVDVEAVWISCRRCWPNGVVKENDIAASSKPAHRQILPYPSDLTCTGRRIAYLARPPRAAILVPFSVTALLMTSIALSVPAGAEVGTTSSALRAQYAGPRTISGPTTLQARAQGTARVVAVTFRLGGKAIATDTTPPYAIDVDGRFLPPGRQAVSVVAVDAVGSRAASPAVPVNVRRGGAGLRVVGPGAAFSRAAAALAKGNVTVRLRPGVYDSDQLRLGSGARLVGSGRRTILRPPGGRPYWAVLVADGTNIRVSNLTVDGGGPGGGIGHAVVVQSGTQDVRLSRVLIRNVRKVGVFAWGAYSGISVQDSELTGAPGAHAGFIAGESGHYGTSRDSSVIRTRVRGFSSFGILFAHAAHGREDAAARAVALDNDVRDIVDPARRGCGTDPAVKGCGTSEGGIWSGSFEAAIIGNSVRRTGWDGIQTVGSSTRTAIVGNHVAETRTGIYLEHATNHSLVARNVVSRVRTGINVEWEYGGVSSRFNTFLGNRIIDADRVGLFVDVGSDGNLIVRNEFQRVTRPAIVLQGSSGNVIDSNRACGGKGPLIDQRVGLRDSGAPAAPARNTVRGNSTRAICSRG